MTRRQGPRRDFLRVGSLGFCGINLPQFLRAAAPQKPRTAKRSRAFCSGWKVARARWILGTRSRAPPSSRSRPTSPGIQISELLPQVAKRMDKLAIVRSMHTKGNDHPQGTHYAITGHEPNPAMHFPSLGAIIAKETGPRNGIPPNVLAPQWETQPSIRRIFPRRIPWARITIRWRYPDPEPEELRVADLTLPKSVSEHAVHSRQDFSEVCGSALSELYKGAEHANMDGFTAQAWKMLLNPSVQHAFDLGKEPEKLRDRYGRDTIGQSALLARRLVESGARFVTAAGFHSNSWDTHAKNDEGHRDRLCPPLDRTLSVLLDDSGRTRSARIDGRAGDGRIRPYSIRESRSRPRSLAHVLVARAWRRRHQGRAGHRSER